MTLNNNIYPQGGLISVWWVYHHQVILNTTPCNPLNSLTSMMLCMCGRRRSRRTSSSMTRALHTFFRTSGSSSVASANRFYRGWKDHGQMSSWHSVKEQTQTVIIIIITWHVCMYQKKKECRGQSQCNNISQYIFLWYTYKDQFQSCANILLSVLSGLSVHVELLCDTEILSL